MKLTLIQTGGFAGLTKRFALDVPWDETQKQQFLRSVAPPNDNDLRRDAFSYSWEVEGQRVGFDPAQLTPIHKRLFESMHKQLVIEQK